MIDFSIAKKEKRLVRMVVQRAKKLWACDSVTVDMSLCACHLNGNELDFEKLLTFDDVNFLHDVCGIVNHINRKTGRLENHFLPKCTKRKELKRCPS